MPDMFSSLWAMDVPWMLLIGMWGRPKLVTVSYGLCTSFCTQ